MADDRMELEMRIEGLGTAAGQQGAERALQALDPGATLRVDDASGIAHVTTTCQTLEVEDALTRAGFEVTAATG